METALDFGTLCLLQIATRKRTFLIDPFAVGDLKPLLDVLNGSGPLKVIHNARFERRVLAAVGIALEGVFDTLEASRRARGVDRLLPNSLRYAALDAEVLLQLYGRFAVVGYPP